MMMSWRDGREESETAARSHSFFSSSRGLAPSLALLLTAGLLASASCGELGEGSAPAAPEEILAEAVSSRAIEVQWTAGCDEADGFRVERAADQEGAPGDWSEVRSLGEWGSSHEDDGLDVEATYWYRIQAFNEAGDSPYSDEVQATTEPGLSGIVDIAATSMLSVAVSEDGGVWAWGSDVYAEDPLGFQQARPVPVEGLSGITAAAGGVFHVLALRDDGTVWAWGAGESGALGDGEAVDSADPVQVSGLSGATAVSAGAFHSLALRDDGTVWAWGNNEAGQLGDGTYEDSSTPVQVSGITEAVDVAAGHYHSLALLEDGSVAAWGRNGDGLLHGVLGDGSDEDDWNVPVPVIGVSDAVALAADVTHSLAVLGNGEVWGWGYDWSGELAAERSDDRVHLVPLAERIGDLDGAVSAAAGQSFSLVLREDGEVYSFGKNDKGQLGDGTRERRLSPVPIPGLDGVTKVTAGNDHSMALLEDGTVWAWGNNGSYQLGDYTRSDRSEPAQVVAP